MNPKIALVSMFHNEHRLDFAAVHSIVRLIIDIHVKRVSNLEVAVQQVAKILICRQHGVLLLGIDVLPHDVTNLAIIRCKASMHTFNTKSMHKEEVVSYDDAILAVFFEGFHQHLNGSLAMKHFLFPRRFPRLSAGNRKARLEVVAPSPREEPQSAGRGAPKRWPSHQSAGRGATKALAAKPPPKSAGRGAPSPKRWPQSASASLCQMRLQGPSPPIGAGGPYFVVITFLVQVAR